MLATYLVDAALWAAVAGCLAYSLWEVVRG